MTSRPVGQEGHCFLVVIMSKLKGEFPQANLLQLYYALVHITVWFNNLVVNIYQLP